jgi:hypothetical protein
MLFIFTASATVFYVDVNSTNPVPPYTNWMTAATNIQNAIDVANSGDEVLVTNGVYQTGTRTISGVNRVAVDGKAVMIQSVNGPKVTVIQGAWDAATNGPNAVRCVYLATGSTLSGFTLTNGATQDFDYGGGVKCASASCLVTNCVITGNAAYDGGGGTYYGTLVNCTLTGNTAVAASVGSGGGAYDSLLVNCVVTRNFAEYIGGAAVSCTLINCTVVSNSAAAYDGSLDSCTVKNSIVYYNFSYYTNTDTGGGGYFTNCCTSFSLLGQGANNITNPPLFANLSAGDYHLTAPSPCINAGNNAYITNSTDLDGNPRVVGGIVDLGAYEFQSPIHYVALNNNNPMSPFTNWVTAATNIQDAVDASSDGDLVLVTNGIYAFGGRDVFGGNRVAVTRAITVQSINGPAATVIKGLTNGANVRCVFLTNGAALVGFTLTNGSSGGSAGGVLSSGFNNSTISNCLIIGNVALDGGGGVGGVFYNCTITGNNGNNGGGVFSVTMYNCLVSGNSAGNGGGCYSGTAYNCRFIGNSAGNGGGGYNSSFQNCLLTGNVAGGTFGGGGACQSSLENCTVVANQCTSFNGGTVGGALNCGACISCIIYNNTSFSDASTPNYSGGGYQYNCCTTPLPSNGFGNFTSDPMLVSQSGGDFHLQSNSPCINAGNNAYVSTTTDLDGNPRIVGGTVDIGAYEYQTPASIISYAWLQQYGLPADGSVDFAGLDGNGMNVYQDWVAGLNPTNAASVLALQAPAAMNTAGLTVTWQSVSGITYFLQSSTNLPAFTTIQSNIVGQAGTTSYTDTSATNGGPYFYRVGVPVQ